MCNAALRGRAAADGSCQTVQCVFKISLVYYEFLITQLLFLSKVHDISEFIIRNSLCICSVVQ